jgi:hypothetical protein
VWGAGTDREELGGTNKGPLVYWAQWRTGTSMLETGIGAGVEMGKTGIGVGSGWDRAGIGLGSEWDEAGIGVG